MVATERSLRRNARSAAHEAFVEKAARQPAKIVEGMRDHPDLIADLAPATLTEIVEILLEKGMKAELLALCHSRRMPKFIRKRIVTMCLFK